MFLCSPVGNYLGLVLLWSPLLLLELQPKKLWLAAVYDMLELIGLVRKED